VIDYRIKAPKTYRTESDHPICATHTLNWRWPGSKRLV